MNMVRTVIFDLDGTIVDTEPAAAQAVVNCFKAWGTRLDEADSHFITGRKWDAAFEFLFRKYRLPVPRARAVTEIMAQFRRGLEAHLEVIPGSVEAVQALSKEFKLGLVSGSNRQDILRSLDRLKITGLFEIILGAEDYAASKPAPDGYLRALSFMKALPAQTLVFEDSHAGIASARAAGTWVVAVEAANHLGQDQSRAHLRIHDLTPVNCEWVRALSFS